MKRKKKEKKAEVAVESREYIKDIDDDDVVVRTSFANVSMRATRWFLYRFIY